MKSTLFALMLALLLPAMPDVSAQTTKPASSKSSSFKSGFSSQKASPTSSSRSPARSSPSFGSFGGARSAPQQTSDSVLSQRLNQSASQANALRTLDARRAAANARRALPPDTRSPSMPAPSPIAVQRSPDGLDKAITGFVLGRATSNRHGHQGVNSNTGRSDAPATAASTNSFFGSLLRTFAWLAVAATLAWIAWFSWKFLRRSQAPSSANYSFER